ncbi:hypothetical protein PIB30_086289 [Stylosanthes scabra]|uniref:Uncharacterized protein n=1 Tax=Stylosanthes scabra TaxID=79078 RepID=A0ABU6RT09_9FABA|nr:hypothetical protein [Stylosanthes scabra]
MERGMNSISWTQSEDSGWSMPCLGSTRSVGCPLITDSFVRTFLRATTEEKQPRLSFRGRSPHLVGYGSGEANPLAISDGAQDAQVLQGKANSFLGHAYLWTRIFEIVPLDLTREDDVELEISHAISSKNIHQMRRNLIPTETEVPPRFQPDIAEFIRKGFEDMRSMMTEGFMRLSDRIDRLDIHMASQDADLRSLRDEFRSFQGEDVYMDVQEQPGDAPMLD